MQVITLDFETLYDREYSLSKMTTEEYIRDYRFEAIGVAVKVDNGETQWFSGTVKKTSEFLDQFPWDTSIAVAHNAMFDMAILNWHFDIRPKLIADTLSMARAIDGPDAGNSLAKLAERHGLGVKGDEVINALGKRRLDFTPAELARYGDYCCNDVELTYKLFGAMAPLMPKVEMRLIDLTMRMFTEPTLQLDKSLLEKHLTTVKEKKDKLLSVALVDKSELMSNPKLAELLRKCGVEPPMKISPTTGKETYAFGKNDEGFKALLEHENIIVQNFVAARMGVKSTLEETRTERFIGIADRGTLPVPLRYYAAHTGRFGGDDKVNLQNIPRKSPLKKAIKAPPGYLLVDCDSSQIEARTLAWLAGQDDLVDAFTAGEDVYKIMASSIYSKRITEVNDNERFVGKTTILGCLAEGTPVLTDRGWVAIEEVATSDRLWDGEEWVCHQGLVPKGIKETLSLCGLWLTPDHKVLCGTQWVEAQSVVQDASTLSLALDTGAVSWLSPGTCEANVTGSRLSSYDATVGAPSIPLTSTTSKTSRAPGAHPAVNVKGTGSGTGNIFPYSPIPHTGSGSSIASAPPSLGATTLTRGHTLTTEVGGSASASNGGTTAPSSSVMPKPYPVGTTPTTIWTAPTIVGGMNRVTSASSPEQTTMPTGGKSASCRQNLMTYDIAYAGPRNRYTVATDAGAIIVHNCGYGMGHVKFQAQLKTFGVELSLDECRYIISVYRQTYPAIPTLWKAGNDALQALTSQRTAPFGREGVLTVDLLGIRLPNGMYLRYPNLRVETDPDGGKELVYDAKKGRSTIKNRIYGGKVVENVCQALARIVIAEQMLMIARRYKVAMTVHDSVVAVVPESEAEEGQAFIEQCMRIRPKWATGLPLNCESKIGASYGG